MAIFAVISSACSTIGPYSETAYQQAVNLKVDSLALVSKADEPFLDHQKDVDTLTLNLMKAYEYAKGRPENDESTKQWQILSDPEGHSLGGFLKLWKEKGHLDATFVQEEKAIIAQEFDTISGLESGKTKESN